MAWLSALAALVAAGFTVAKVLVSRRRARMALPKGERERDTEHAETTVYCLPANIDAKATVEFAIPVRRETAPPVRREATPRVGHEASTPPVTHARAVSVHEAPTREFAAYFDRANDANESSTPTRDAPTREFAAHFEHAAALGVHSAPTREFSAHVEATLQLAKDAAARRDSWTHRASADEQGNEDLTSMDVMLELELLAHDKIAHAMSAPQSLLRNQAQNDGTGPVPTQSKLVAQQPALGRGLPPPSQVAYAAVGVPGRTSVAAPRPRAHSSSVHPKVRHSGYAPVDTDPHLESADHEVAGALAGQNRGR